MKKVYDHKRSENTLFTQGDYVQRVYDCERSEDILFAQGEFVQNTSGGARLLLRKVK
ncbi:hypothetical protein N476_19335 [Pseudoalteromonas luteoviolacea H33]|uniref:Uncharacterized protein n=1 Tax=Pseudoalteromonas luteoviolacea H33 TaxID=1365251 RepID=A0A167DW16_9GAMM|nr:hypothetical protein N476_19335 [Pseudoalteromonas luteoviolacea H33]KZN72626.1 hypothetical protein N477_24845 [Pseudoalteromonas luteoviolacea H33-S]